MKAEIIHNKIYEVRDEKIMLDFDLAKLYEVETRIFNQA
ncbi:MAG: ORF6N domain-containing protein, partial [Chitinophagaceae bacterium]|nr:ORF6N domain-containing protein [Chitinophagaceae bacterium]